MESNVYVDLIKNAKVKKIKLVPNRRQAWNGQKGVCAKCKKDLNPCYCKYIEDSSNKFGFQVLCLDCVFKKK